MYTCIYNWSNILVFNLLHGNLISFKDLDRIDDVRPDLDFFLPKNKSIVFNLLRRIVTFNAHKLYWFRYKGNQQVRCKINCV